VIRTDVGGTSAVGVLWWKIQERGVPVVKVRAKSRAPGASWTAMGDPTRGPGDLSRVKGGTLRLGEYEHQVALVGSDISQILVELTLASGEIMSVGPFALDADAFPTIASLAVVGQTIQARGDTDTLSWRATKVGGGWSADLDGSNADFVVPIPADESWEVQVTAYGDTIANRGPGTLTAMQEVTVLGVNLAEPTWSVFEAAPPVLGSGNVTITMEATSAPTGYKARLFMRTSGTEAWDRIDGSVSPRLYGLPTAPPVELTYATPFTRFAWGFTKSLEFKADILNAFGMVISTSPVRAVEWMYK
jgi:hypothetical protein